MRRIILLMLMSLLGLLFTACGGTLNTTVELEQDMSGRRIMKYEVSKEDFQEYSNVSIAVAEQQVSRNCPEGWQYEFKQTQDSYVLTFIMPFSSIEDAQTKMEAVTGSAGSCGISYYQASGVFCEGFSYEEAFEAESLFTWFKDVLVNCGCVDLSYLTYIINESETKLLYGGREYHASDTLVAKEFSYISIEGIEISTYVNGDGTYNRTLTMSMQEVNLEKRKEKILAFMEESVPDGASGEWTKKNGMHTHTVTMQNLSAEEMQKAMQTYTHSEETIFETREHEAQEEDYALLTREISYAEYMDFREYGSSAKGEVRIQYVQNNENMDGELYFCLNKFSDWKISSIFGEEWRFWNFSDNETDKVGDGVQTYNLSYLDRVSLVYRGVYYFDVTEVAWNTEVWSQNNLESQLIFFLEENTFEEETDALVYACEQKIAKENLTGVTVEKVKIKGLQAVVFTFTGSDSDINRVRRILTETQGSSVDVLKEQSLLACFEEKNLYSLTKTIVFEESVWPQGFLASPESYGKELKVTYSLVVAGEEMSKKEGVPSEVYYGGEYQDEVRIGVIHETLNPMAVLFFLLIAVGVISILVGVMFLLIAVMKKIRKAQNKKARVSSEVTPVAQKHIVSNENKPTYDAAAELVADLFGADSDSAD